MTHLLSRYSYFPSCSFLSYGRYFVRRYYSLRSRGFWVTRQGRDAIEYQEFRNGKVERLTIDGEMMVGARHVVYVPTAEDWKRTMPDWAEERREEIIANVKRKLGTKSYEYEYLVDDAKQI